MKTGRVDIHIGAQTREFAAGATRVKGHLNDISGQIMKLPGIGQLGQFLTNPIVAATAAAAAFVRQLDRTIARVEQLRDLSAQIGGTTSDAQSVRYAAGISGMSEGGMVQAVDSIRRAMGEASIGKAEYTKALETLGFSGESLRGATPFGVLQGITERMSRGLTAAEYAAVSKVAGGSTRELLAASGRGLPEALASQAPFELSERDVDSASNTAGLKRKAMTVGAMLIDRALMAWLNANVTKYGAGAAALLNIPAAAGIDSAGGLRDSILQEVMLNLNPPAGSVGRLQTQLHSRQEGAMSLAALRQANLAAAFDARFKGLSAADQLSVMQGAYGAGMSALGSLSPAAQEGAIGNLMRMAQDIRSLEQKAVDSLERIEAGLNSPD